MIIEKREFYATFLEIKYIKEFYLSKATQIAPLYFYSSSQSCCRRQY